MGLIDAETLEEQGWIMQRTVRVDASTMEWQQRKPTEFPAEQYVPKTSYDSLEDTCKSLRKALAYAVPVKHGEWIHDRQLYRCSACGELWLHWNDLVPLEQMYKNCPHCPMCGARMDGGKPL